ncbi:MAG: hypothetical protein ACRCY4_04470 [Brevinema sp.]
MSTTQTFYFRPIISPLVLSSEFLIGLRNPTSEELPLAQQNIRVLFGGLSDKEKRRVLYTLYPFGVDSPQGSLDEIFIKALAKIWVYAEDRGQSILSWEEYGALGGFYTEHGHLINPCSFTADVRTTSQRAWLRALKKELPVASSLIELPQADIRLFPLKDFCTKLDGVLAQKEHHRWLKQLAGILASPATTQEELFLKYTMAAEVLLVPKSSEIGKKFAEKHALLHYLCLKDKGQKVLESPHKIEKFFTKAYKKRSEMVHGVVQTVRIPVEPLFYNVRLGLELMVNDPILFFYLRNL